MKVKSITQKVYKQSKQKLGMGVNPMETEKIQTFNADITVSIKSEKDLTEKEVKRKIKSMITHDQEFRLNLCQKVERVDNNE